MYIRNIDYENNILLHLCGIYHSCFMTSPFKCKYSLKIKEFFKIKCLKTPRKSKEVFYIHFFFTKIPI